MRSSRRIPQRSITLHPLDACKILSSLPVPTEFIGSEAQTEATIASESSTCAGSRRFACCRAYNQADDTSYWLGAGIGSSVLYMPFFVNAGPSQCSGLFHWHFSPRAPPRLVLCSRGSYDCLTHLASVLDLLGRVAALPFRCAPLARQLETKVFSAPFLENSPSRHVQQWISVDRRVDDTCTSWLLPIP
jgi:hypothetical protein